MPASTISLPAIPDLQTGLRILARLPMANPIEAQHEVGHVLDSLAQTPLAPESYLELLEHLRSPLRSIEDDLARRVDNRPLPLDEAEERLFEQVTSMWLKMSDAYDYCFTHEAPDEQARRALMLQRRIFYTGQAMIEHHRSRRELPAGLWKSAHDLFSLAERNGLETQAVEDTIASPGRETHCAATYASLLLTELAGPFGLSLRDQQLVRRWASHWSPLATIRHFVKDEPLPIYVIDQTQDVALVLGREGLAGETLRCLDTSRLASQLRHLTHQLQSRATPSELGLGEDCTAGQCRRLLDHLAAPWGQTHSPRKFPRHAATTIARICSGLDAIHYFISGKEFLVPDSLAQQSRQAYETLFAFRHMVEPEKPLEFQHEKLGFATEDWAVIDHSASGLRLSREAPGKKVVHGQLLGVSPNEGEPFFLAHITWLMQENSGELIAGVEALAGSPQAIAMRPLTQTESRHEPWSRALLLPAVPAMGVEETMILPPGGYRALRVVEINGETTRRVELLHIVNAGPDYERVSFAPARDSNVLR